MASVSPDGDQEIEQVNIKMTATLLERVDDTWQGRGFNSRSEYIRYVLHDAVEFPTFDRDELIAIAQGEHEIRTGGPSMSREEVLDEFDIDADDGE